MAATQSRTRSASKSCNERDEQNSERANPAQPVCRRGLRTGRVLRRKAANGPENVRGVTRSGARAILILAAAAVAAVGPALSGRAQGSIELDNSQSSGRVVLGAPGNYYDYGGVYGVEVWMLNTSRLPPGIMARVPSEVTASLQTDFFTREATFADQNNSSTPGVIRLGELDMRTVAPYGATVVIALAMWDNAAPSFSAGVFNELPPGNGGVLAFVNPTADYTAIPDAGAAGPERLDERFGHAQSHPGAFGVHPCGLGSDGVAAAAPFQQKPQWTTLLAMNATNETANVLTPPSGLPGGACAPGASCRRRTATGPGSLVARSGARAILMLATAALAASGPASGARAQGNFDWETNNGLVTITGFGGVGPFSVTIAKHHQWPPGHRHRLWRVQEQRAD